MARRGNGEGSIRLRTDGRWEAVIRVAGRRQWLMGKSRSEVQAKLSNLKRQLHMGEWVEPQRLTLGEFLDQWLEAGEADWKPKTLHGYGIIVRHYWKSELGHIQLQKLTPAMLVACYAKWRKSNGNKDSAKGRTGGTLLNVHRCLHRALVVAVRWGLVARNVAALVEPPRAQRHHPELWSQEQAAQFLAVTKDDPWHVVWSVLLGTGCRLGEAVGLRWSQVELDKGSVTISSAVGYVGQAPVEGSPKTRAGVRVLSVPPFTVSALRAWKDQTKPTNTDAFVFTLPDGRPPAPWHARNAFLRACKRAGLPPIRRHDLRHLAASLMLAEGLPLPAVAAQLGHANTAVTVAVYSHALRGSDQRVAHALERALGGGPGTAV